MLTNSRSYILPMNGKPAGGVMYGELPSASVFGNPASLASSPKGYRSLSVKIYKNPPHGVKVWLVIMGI